MYHFQIFSKDEKAQYIDLRSGETHLGECIGCCTSESDVTRLLQSTKVKFVLLGLPEDVGVRANCGLGGADTSWQPFLKSFLNIQESNTLSGRSVFLYGSLTESSNTTKKTKTSVAVLREQTAALDYLIFPIIKKIIKAGKIPIVIGGGHNNAYPILKGASLAFKKPINALNTDAHADFRIIEGRHSGNGFRYAFAEGYLKKYFALGLHEAYNSREILEKMDDFEDVKFNFWEDIFLRKKFSWLAAQQQAIDHVSNDFFGVELDTDCIENTLSSAASPVGISSREAMQTLYDCGQNPNAIYLHLPEAAYLRADGLRNPYAGKLLSYLVQAFIKGVLERQL